MDTVQSINAQGGLVLMFDERILAAARVRRIQASDSYKIIVPSVHRESYLHGMRQATRRGRFRTMVKVLHQLHCYTASIDWLDYEGARHTLELHAANQEPDEGVPTFNRALRQFRHEYLPD